MSVLSKLQSKKNGNDNKKDWTKSDLKLAIGMKLHGCSRKEIGLGTGHYSYDADGKLRVHSVTYALTTKIEKMNFTEEGFAEYFGVSTDEDQQNQEFKDYATAELKRRQAESTEESTEEVDQAQEEVEEVQEEVDEQAS